MPRTAQTYTYGEPETAQPYQALDASRVISFFIFNTDVHMHAYAADGEDEADPAVRAHLDGALTACRDRCLFFEERFSRMREGSDIARAHAASPEPVGIAPETADLVRQAIDYCERSQGFFDITMGTVTSLWDFHRGIVPSGLALSHALPHVGYDKISVGESPSCADAPTLAITDPATILDLGGVAKGYIADDLARLLEERSVMRFVLNLGGNVLVRGGRAEDDAARPPVHAGEPWKIGIVNPFDTAHYRAIVDVAEVSVVTSGLHERRFTRGGVTYHHILSPADGMPAKTDVVSATIVAPRSMDCDGYSTTALMMGADRALAFVEGLPGIEAVIITDADEVRWTSGLDERLALVPTLPRW